MTKERDENRHKEDNKREERGEAVRIGEKEGGDERESDKESDKGRERERERENWDWIKKKIFFNVVRILCIVKSFCQFSEIDKCMFWLGLDKFLLKFKIGEADVNVYNIWRKVLKCLFLYWVILGQTNFAYIFIIILGQTVIDCLSLSRELIIFFFFAFPS